MQLIELALLRASFKTLAFQNRGSVDTGALTDSQVAILTIAMDQIISAADGLPSASQAGGLQYLRSLGWQYAEIRENIGAILNALEETSGSEFHRTFYELGGTERLHVLSIVEKGKADTFSTFVAYVYEAYYSNPRVLGLISCSPSLGPATQDEVLLAPVKKLSHLYREVP